MAATALRGRFWRILHAIPISSSRRWPQWSCPRPASGGLSCSLEDQSVRIAIESGVTRGMGGPVFNFRGTLEILDKAVRRRPAPDGVRRAASAAVLAQRDARCSCTSIVSARATSRTAMSIYVIETQAGDDEGLYGGSYR